MRCEVTHSGDTTRFHCSSPSGPIAEALQADLGKRFVVSLFGRDCFARYERYGELVAASVDKDQNLVLVIRSHFDGEVVIHGRDIADFVSRSTMRRWSYLPTPSTPRLGC